ncbi:MAG: hypothetical protein QOJ81_1633 [Chloroflexota bacterium]|nr:hypothetical protein [Chloroflexota bacterium]
MTKTFALLALVLTTLLTACNGAVGASPTPTNGPTSPPTNPPTPSPSPTFGPNEIEHPTGATDIVLRIEQGGGFVPFGFLLTQSPSFTLYGDGTVIFKPVDNRAGDPFGGQAMLPWLVGHMTEADIQTLLNYALTTGRLANAHANYDNPMVADAGSTIFNINAGGVDKVVNVYALGLDDGPDAADRAGFTQLAEVLNDFQNQSGLDLGELTAYEPELYKLLLMEGFGDPVGQTLDWPWDDLTVADWPDAEEPDGRIAFLDAEHVAKLIEVPNGGHVGIWVTTPDGVNVQFGIRPLLPDEVEAHNSAS